MKKVNLVKNLALKTYREWQKLNRERRKLGYYKLKAPIQKGWTVVCYVRDDILRSSDAHVFQRILPHIQPKKIVSRKTEEFIQDGFNVIHDLGNGEKEEIPFGSISQHRKNKIDFPEYYWTKYFDKHSVLQSYANVTIVSYHLKRQWERCFRFAIVPNYITEIPIIDPDLESQYKIIWNKMRRNNWWKYIGSNDDGYRYEGYMKAQKELEKEFYDEIRSGK